MIFNFVDGAAETEATARANRQDLDSFAILPHSLRDVSSRDTSVSLFGKAGHGRQRYPTWQGHSLWVGRGRTARRGACTQYSGDRIGSRHGIERNNQH
jgi:hypothetical protein